MRPGFWTSLCRGHVSGWLTALIASTHLSRNNSCYPWQQLSNIQLNLELGMLVTNSLEQSQVSSWDRCRFLLALVFCYQRKSFMSPQQANSFRRIQRPNNLVGQRGRAGSGRRSTRAWLAGLEHGADRGHPWAHSDPPQSCPLLGRQTLISHLDHLWCALSVPEDPDKQTLIGSRVCDRSWKNSWERPHCWQWPPSHVQAPSHSTGRPASRKSSLPWVTYV